MENAIKTEAIIECENLFAGYGSELVLRDVSVKIPEGSFVLVMGPNGAGKTTLLRVMLGLLKSRSGRVRTPFDVTPPGYVPQQKNIDLLYPVSVRKIIELGLYHELGWWRRSTGNYRERVDAALRQFNLYEHDRKIFSELSGGMRQKTLIARAFVSGAEVFIFDEPTSELDAESEDEVFQHLIRLTREHGKTVLLVHHGIGESVKLGDLVCLVDHGKAVLVKPEEFLASKDFHASRVHRQSGEAE